MKALCMVKVKNSHQPTPGDSNNSVNQKNQTTTGCKKRKSHMVLTYIQGLSESFKKVCGKYGVHIFFTGGKILKNIGKKFQRTSKSYLPNIWPL